MEYLTKEVENDLIKQFQSTKNEKLRNEIFKKVFDNNVRFCSYIIKKRITEEVVQDFRVSIINAMVNFNCEYDVKFTTFLIYHLKLVCYKKTETLECYEDNIKCETKVDTKRENPYMEKIEFAYDFLNAKDKKMLKLYLETQNYRVMASRTQVTYQRCHQIMKNIFQKIRDIDLKKPKRFEEQFNDVYLNE